MENFNQFETLLLVRDQSKLLTGQLKMTFQIKIMKSIQGQGQGQLLMSQLFSIFLKIST